MTDLNIHILLGLQNYQSSAHFVIIRNLILAHSGGNDYQGSHHKSTKIGEVRAYYRKKRFLIFMRTCVGDG